MELSKLEEIDPRLAWPGEASHFTPWLLENADRLSSALGIDIDLSASEHPVGVFSLDLFGHDLTNNTPLIVENQLTPTDHTHLGQLLTYAAGTEASTIVWIATSFREEHRQAIDWLNQRTGEDVHFFGVKLRLVQIADSPFAPLFDVVAQPNDWQKRIHAAAGPKSMRSSGVDWSLAHEAIKAIPQGRWTAVHDLATLVGTSPGWMGRHLYGERHLPHLHRMLYPDGSGWKWFRWPSDDDERSQTTVLKEEGVKFDQNGRALQADRLGHIELASLLPGQDVEGPDTAAPSVPPDGSTFIEGEPSSI